MSHITKKWILRIGKFCLPVVILSFVFLQSKKELANLSIKDSLVAIKQMPAGGFEVVILLGLLAVATMFFYDFLLIKSLNLDVPIWKIFRTSWTANTINGVAGFGGLAGAGIRAMLYREHTDDSPKLIRSIAWMTPAMISGLSLLSFFVITNIFSTQELLSSKHWLLVALIGVFLFLPFYLISSKFKGKGSASPLLLFKYTMVSVIEWLAAGSVVYIILVLLGADASITSVYGVYLASAVAGIISLVPGGFGTFDLTFLVGLNFIGVQEDLILTSLLLYRLVYFLIPFVIGLILAIFEFGGTALKKVEDKPIIGPALETTSVLWSLQRNFLSQLSYWAFAILVFITGLFQLILTLSPPVPSRASLLLHIFPPSVLVIANGILFGSSIILLFSVAIYRRTQRSYWVVFGALVTGLIANLVKGLNIEEAIWFGVLLAIFYFSKHLFTRIRRRITVSGSLIKGVIFGYIIYIYTILWIDIQMSNESIPGGIYYNLKDFYITFVVAILFIIAYTLGSILLFEKKQTEQFGIQLTKEQLQTFFETHGGTYLSHLAFLGDKQFFLSADEKVLFQFGRNGKKIIILGDPMGVEQSFREALKEIYARADKFGYEVIFYQVKSEYMALYHDFGNSFFKLGEDAVVDLPSFTTSGKKRSNMRAITNKFEREGYTFQVMTPPFSAEWLDEIQDISSAWIGKKPEKGFSLGFFDKEYLSCSPIATIKNSNDKIIAFVNLMPVYNEPTLSIDLMRYYPDAPSGVMDVMFIHLFEWARDEGYTSLNIGMAPLSNVGQTSSSFLAERVAGEVFNKVRYMYSFSGLRQFKSKYSPVWEGRYLAYRKNRSLPFTMIKTTKLISKGKKHTKKDSLPTTVQIKSQQF